MCLLTPMLFSLVFVLLLNLLLFFSCFDQMDFHIQKELVFPAVMTVLDEPPTFSYYLRYHLVRDHRL